MNEALLERIAVALEGINEELKSISDDMSIVRNSLEKLEETIDDCTIEDPIGKIVRIGGAVAKL